MPRLADLPGQGGPERRGVGAAARGSAAAACRTPRAPASDRSCRAAVRAADQVPLDPAAVGARQLAAGQQRQAVADPATTVPGQSLPMIHRPPASRHVTSCRRSQCSRNSSRALASRHRTVASRRPTIAATSADENPSRSRSTRIVRYGTGIRSRTNWTSWASSAWSRGSGSGRSNARRPSSAGRSIDERRGGRVVAAELVEAEVHPDPEQPGAEPPRRVEPVEPVVHLPERLLRQVAGQLLVVDQAGQDADRASARSGPPGRRRPGRRRRGRSSTSRASPASAVDAGAARPGRRRRVRRRGRRPPRDRRPGIGFGRLPHRVTSCRRLSYGGGPRCRWSFFSETAAASTRRIPALPAIRPSIAGRSRAVGVGARPVPPGRHVRWRVLAPALRPADRASMTMTGWTPEVAAVPAEDRGAALGVLYRRVPASLRPRLIADALAEAERGMIDLSGLWVARRRGRVVGALLTQPLAGRAAAVWAPEVDPSWRRAATAVALVRAALDDLRARGFLLAQALLDESAPQHGAADLAGGGMPHVTDLVYLEADTARPARRPRRTSRRSTGRRSGPTTEADFRAVLQATYVDSLDMPELEGHPLARRHPGQPPRRGPVRRRPLAGRPRPGRARRGGGAAALRDPRPRRLGGRLPRPDPRRPGPRPGPRRPGPRPRPGPRRTSPGSSWPSTSATTPPTASTARRASPPSTAGPSTWRRS